MRISAFSHDRPLEPSIKMINQIDFPSISIASNVPRAIPIIVATIHLCTMYWGAMACRNQANDSSFFVVVPCLQWSLLGGQWKGSMYLPMCSYVDRVYIVALFDERKNDDTCRNRIYSLTAWGRRWHAWNQEAQIQPLIATNIVRIFYIGHLRLDQMIHKDMHMMNSCSAKCIQNRSNIRSMVWYLEQ